VILRWDAPGPYTVAFSSRQGGVSEGRYESLNLGLLTADEPERVEQNRRLLCEEVRADPEQLALNRQVHGPRVRRARAGGRGERADGLWTDQPGLPMLAMTADCLPVAVARVTRTRSAAALAVLHVGWRGLLAGVIANGVAAIGGRLAAAIGPGIGPCCYEVGPGVAERFDPGLLRGRNLDLWTAAERALRTAGVEEIERTDICTSCNPDLYFSHRRDRGDTGRQGVIGLVVA
jgi:purine-nucleoside/S-methyl-5'-thioadenosine phosphorylase / adenosine deaminase